MDRRGNLIERIAWTRHIRLGHKEEHIRRHKEPGPEMKEVLKRSDICNYTIFAEEGRLFGYYECGKGVALAQAQRRDELAGLRWNRYMETFCSWG